MASGFFLGGAADGAMSAQKQALAEQTQAQDVGLRSRGLDLQETQLNNTMSQQVQAQADKQIAETMAVAAETIKAGLEGGADPAKVRAAVMPLVQSAQSIAARAGRDPNALAAQIDAQLTSPGPVAAAGVKGRASAAQRVAEAHGIAAATGQGVEISPFKEEKDRIAAENRLMGDFRKDSANFVTVRDFYDRMKSATPNGPGDISLIFSYMKLLDPASTVREGEYATAQNSGGVPSTIQGMYNKLVGGGTLEKGVREDIKSEGGKIWSTSLSRHASQVDQYRKIAKSQGLRPSNVIIDLTAGSEGPITGNTSTGTSFTYRP